MKSLPSRLALCLAIAALPAIQPAIGQETPPSSSEVTTATATQRALANPHVVTVRNVTHAELVMDLPIADSAGYPLGTVVRIAGNDVILRDDTGVEFAVPVVQLYAFTKDGSEGYASRVPRAQLLAGSSASTPAP